MNQGRPILVDTVAILEAHQVGIWNALAGHYRIETVEPCVMETQTGFQLRRPELQIDEKTLRSQLYAVHAVSDEQLAAVIANGGAGLDEGEQALWAHAIHRDDAWILCGPDRASMRFGYNNKHRERLISLGELSSLIGLKPKLRDHFTKQWLDKLLSNLALGIL